jgi:tetratricopeptide (TPR) repeat protein
MRIWFLSSLVFAGVAHAQTPVVLRGLPLASPSGVSPKVIWIVNESQAQEALKERNFTGAAEIYAQLAREAPTSALRTKFLGLETRTRTAKRIATLEEKADAALKLRRWSEAGALYQQILTIPNFSWKKDANLDFFHPTAIVAQTRSAARWNLGRCCFEQKKYAAALREFQTNEPQPVAGLWCGNAISVINHSQTLWQSACLEGIGRYNEAVGNYARLSLDSPFFVDETAARRLIALYRNAGQLRILQRWLDAADAQQAARARKNGWKQTSNDRPTNLLRHVLASRQSRNNEASETDLAKISFPSISRQPLPSLDKLKAISAKEFA